jgi:hypothetical protein
MVEKEAAARRTCPGCDRPVADDELHACLICRSLFCQRCAVSGFGRQFCSSRCRDTFFYGDGEDDERDY